MTRPDDRLELLQALARRTPVRELPEALDVAVEVTDPYLRAQLLTALAPRLPASLMATALGAAEQLAKESYRRQVLEALAPALPTGLTPRALAAADQIIDEFLRGQVLAALVPRLPDDLLGPALAAARQMATEDGRVPVLTALASRLPDGLLQQVWTQALNATHMVRDYLMAPLQSVLAQSLPVGLSACRLTEALTAARKIADEEQRAPLLAGLAPQLPSGQQQVMAEALAAAAQISRYGGARRAVLAHLAGPLADLLPVQAGRMWRDILPLLARYARPETMEDIQFVLAYVPDTGNRPQTARTVADTVIAVGNWWP